LYTRQEVQIPDVHSVERAWDYVADGLAYYTKYVSNVYILTRKIEPSPFKP
jgi:hypothetical protein